MLRAGTIIAGTYALVAPIGEGGMGAVWRAMQQSLGRPAAIKVIRPEAMSPEAVARFHREARSAARVRHRNVVAIYDAGTTAEGLHFPAMELLEGESLRQRLDRAPRPSIAETLEIAVGVRGGLAAAHDAAIVHRDLKPDNVFLARDADGVVPKIVDFGISRTVGADAIGAPLTQTSAALGTPLYMVFEQLTNARDVDLRADIYSAGVILYEALCGRLPYEADSLGALVAKLFTTTPAPLVSVRPEVGRQLSDVVMWALAREREQRPVNARALRDALQAAARALPAGAVVSGTAPTVPVLAQPAPAAAIPTVTSLPPANAGTVMWMPGATPQLGSPSRAAEPSGAQPLASTVPSFPPSIEGGPPSAIAPTQLATTPATWSRLGAAGRRSSPVRRVVPAIAGVVAVASIVVAGAVLYSRATNEPTEGLSSMPPLGTTAIHGGSPGRRPVTTPAAANAADSALRTAGAGEGYRFGSPAELATVAMRFRSVASSPHASSLRIRSAREPVDSPPSGLGGTRQEGDSYVLGARAALSLDAVRAVATTARVDATTGAWRDGVAELTPSLLTTERTGGINLRRETTSSSGLVRTLGRGTILVSLAGVTAQGPSPSGGRGSWTFVVASPSHVGWVSSRYTDPYRGCVPDVTRIAAELAPDRTNAFVHDATIADVGVLVGGTSVRGFVLVARDPESRLSHVGVYTRDAQCGLTRLRSMRLPGFVESTFLTSTIESGGQSLLVVGMHDGHAAGSRDVVTWSAWLVDGGERPVWQEQHATGGTLPEARRGIVTGPTTHGPNGEDGYWPLRIKVPRQGLVWYVWNGQTLAPVPATPTDLAEELLE